MMVKEIAMKTSMTVKMKVDRLNEEAMVLKMMALKTMATEAMMIFVQ